MHRRRIGFFCGSDNQASGINKVVKNLVSALAEGNPVVLKIYYIVSKKRDVKSGKYDEVYLGFPNLRKAYFASVFRIAKTIKSDNLNTVVFSGMEWGLTFLLATLGSGVRTLAWEHRNFEAGPKFRLEWIGKRIAVRRFDATIVLTKKDEELYKGHFVKWSGKVHQIYNLVTYQADRKEYAHTSRRIVSCGYLSPIKGFDMLVDIAAKVLVKNPEWSWDIYGEGTERERIFRMIQERGLDGKVNLLGFDPEINKKYVEYSFFVMTSRTEGFPGVLIEAQKAGLPFVAFDILTGPSETVVDGVNGFLIPPFDVDMMSQRICDLIFNPDMRKFFSKNTEIKHSEINKSAILSKWMGIL